MSGYIEVTYSGWHDEHTYDDVDPVLILRIAAPHTGQGCPSAYPTNQCSAV